MRTFPKFGKWLFFGVALALAASAWASPRKAETAVFRGEVVRFDAAAITLRSTRDPRIIRTFTYSPAEHAKVEKLLETSSYPYGDRVKVRYRPGTSVALAIIGKPVKLSRHPRERRERK